MVNSYLQQFGVDFDQTFAAIVKPIAFRVLFAIAAYYDLDINQIDIKTAFFYRLIDQLIYVEIAKGTETEVNKDIVCKLLKALYGLKQFPQLWFERLSGFLLEKFGLARIHADHSIFITKAGLNGPIRSKFIDDINVIAPQGSGIIQRIKTELTAAFSMVDMGSISFYLGLKIEQNREKRTIKLSHLAYIDKVLNRFHFDEANAVDTLMKETTLFQPRAEGDGERTAAKKKRYQGMTGCIIFSMVETKPDISFATSVASRFAKNPGYQHIKALKTIFHYLKSSRDQGISYGGQDKLLVERYSESDWAGDKDSRKSTSGFIFMLNRGPVSWCSKKQPTVALSCTEAEYIALTLAAKEAMWLRLLLTKLGLIQPDEHHALIKVFEHKTSAHAIENNLDIACGGGEIVIPLKSDNQGSIALAHNPVFYSRTKNINIQHNYIRNEVASRRIQLS